MQGSKSILVASWSVGTVDFLRIFLLFFVPRKITRKSWSLKFRLCCAEIQWRKSAAAAAAAAGAAAARAAAAAARAATAMEFFEGGDFEQPPRGYLKRRCASKSSKRSMDGEHLISLEHDAYRAVLRAFGAQSEHLTWEKERVMTDLRKELRVSDEHHRDMLVSLVGDETLAKLRDFNSNNTAPAPEPPELPKRKNGPGRPRGSKKKKPTTTGLDDNQGASGPGQFRSKPKKVQHLSSFVKPEEEFQLLTLDGIEAQMDQVEGDGKADLARILSLLKAAEDHKRRILEEMAECGLDEDGVEKMELDTREEQAHDDDMQPARDELLAGNDEERQDHDEVNDDDEEEEEEEKLQIDSTEAAETDDAAVKDEG